MIRISIGVDKLFAGAQKRQIAYSAVEIGCGDDVITCACDGADGHELCCLATRGRHGRHTSFECGNALFKDVLGSVHHDFFKREPQIASRETREARTTVGFPIRE